MAIKEPNFRLLLAFAWENGVRPQEIRAIEARHVDFEKKRIVFPPKEAKGKKRHRIVYLTDEGIEILGPPVEANAEGPIFRNSEGAAWNKNSINCAFCRLKEKIGRKLHMGAWRKGYATITIDAMGARRAIAAQIIEGGADFVPASKANQEALYRGVIDHPAQESETNFAHVEAQE